MPDQHKEDFIVIQLDLDPYPALAVFENMRARLRKPTMTAQEFFAAIERNGAWALLPAQDLTLW